MCAQILKEQKDTDNLTEIFTLSGSAHVKAVHKMSVKLTQGRQKIGH